ncbi:MAG: hypothetical protein WDN45_10760 [Caulobacteraceae bacterium]
MADVFSEVDEQLRAERLSSFLRTAVPVFIATAVLCVIVVVAVWGVQKFRPARAPRPPSISGSAGPRRQG